MIVDTLLAKVIGTQNERDLKKLRPIVAEINSKEADTQRLSDEQLRAMFRNPHYRGPYLVWRQKGDAYVDAVIQEVRQIWRPMTTAHSTQHTAHSEGT